MLFRSIKIRVQGNANDQSNQEIARAVSDAGADFIVVHGRHWSEHYETSCRYDEIKFFVQALKIPVIGNGDIQSVESLKQMFLTGCAGAMIGRAGVGQPWLIKKLISEFNHQPFIMPTSAEIGSMFLEHIVQLIELLNSEKLAILQARKFAQYYGRTLAEKKEFNHAVNTCERFGHLQKLVRYYFNI